jgi:MFS family permease
MALGPIVGGLFISLWGVELGVRFAFVGALGMAILAAILQQTLIEDDQNNLSGASNFRAEHNPFRLWKHMNATLKQLLVADILIRFCEQIPYAFVVVWAVGTVNQSGPVSALQFGTLRAIEMATAVLVYLPVAYLADRTHKKPFVVITFVFFTLFPLVLLFSRSFELLIIAFVLRGLKEFGEPTRKALIMDLSPEEYKAGMFGLYYLARDVIVSVAAFGGAFLWTISPVTNLLTAFAFGVLGTIWFAIRGRDMSMKARYSL